MNHKHLSKKNISNMRDPLLEKIYQGMFGNKHIFFVTADFGSPVIDKIRRDFPERFINVGIAEQNLINVSTGLALEGFVVYAYCIAAFLTTRAYEQIKTSLCLLAQIKTLNINLIGVGAGLSYDISGAAHHCLEDISIMNTLPNISILSPSDYILSEAIYDYSMKNNGTKYIRLDSKPVKQIYQDKVDIAKGFYTLSKGEKACLVSTGYMTQVAINVLHKLKKENISIGLIDIVQLKPIASAKLAAQLKGYAKVISLEEGFIQAGGLDAMIWNVINEHNLAIKFIGLGVKRSYVFHQGNREWLHQKLKLDENSIANYIFKLVAVRGKK